MVFIVCDVLCVSMSDSFARFKYENRCSIPCSEQKIFAAEKTRMKPHKEQGKEKGKE